MSLTLRDCVAEFTGTEQIGIFMIHLRRASERMPIIVELEAAIKNTIEIWDAVEGSSLITAGHPTLCGIDKGVIRTAGEIGCMASHIAIMVEALGRGLSYVVIFEDDCTSSSGFTVAALQDYLRKAKRFATDFQMDYAKELLLLSTCGCYSWRRLTAGIKATQHFNGCHAYMISAKLMRATIAFYVDLLKMGLTAPIDGILPILLQRERLWALCPEQDTALFKQNRDIPSYIVSDGTERRVG